MSPLQAIVQALFPTTCCVCGRTLAYGERQLCLHCIASLEVEPAAPGMAGRVEQLLTGRVPFQSAAALYRFAQGGAVQAVVHSMKFHGNDALCRMMGRQLGLSLVADGRFDEVDVLVPVPLHWRRSLARGYNQSELLCRGIAEVMPRKVESKAVVRHRYTHKQSRQWSAARRAGNVDAAFSVRHPERLEGRHVLLVDDVVTTGATLTACADALKGVPGIRISVATLCVAG